MEDKKSLKQERKARKKAYKKAKRKYPLAFYPFFLEYFNQNCSLVQYILFFHILCLKDTSHLNLHRKVPFLR